MDWSDTPEQAAFRRDVAEMIATHLPAAYRRPDVTPSWQTDRVSADPELRGAAEAWVAALAARGWIAPAWPREYGGGGLTPMEQFIYNHEMANAEAPMVGGQAVTQIGPAIIIHGTPELKERHLPPILSGAIAWCQGFSEPGAGSDLASLATSAVRDGDEYVVNGQKIWTSNAHAADWIALLTRTDPDAPKHRGISFLLVDMRSPGIAVRPLINMGGEHGFNEVFFEDVRVPVEQRVGEEHRGWYVSVTLLDFERSRIRQAVDARRGLETLVAYLCSGEGRARHRLARGPGARMEVADRALEIEVAFNLAFRVVTMQAAGTVPNYEASMLQMTIFETMQRLGRTSARAFGLYGQLTDADEPWAPLRGEPGRAYMQTVGITIAGGTVEIQRNIIATRGLGLPRG